MVTTATPTQGNVTISTTGCYRTYVMPGETKAMTIYLPVFMAIILVTSLVGNTLVIRGVLITRPKTPSYYLIANLATAELISTFLAPFYFHYHSSPFEWAFGKFMCKFVDTLHVCCYLVVSSMLASLSVYFFCVLVSPTGRRPSRLTCCILVALSWVWGIALASPTSVGKDFKEFAIPNCSVGKLYHCFITYPSQKMADAVNITLFICQLIIPFLVMALCYGIVVVKVKQHIRVLQEDVVEMSEMGTAQFQSQTNDTTMTLNDDARPSLAQSTAENQENGQPNKTIKMERRLLKMIYVMIVIYFVCYTPDHIMYIAKKLIKWQWYVNWPYHLIVRKHMRVLHSLPAALHPFLYGCLSRIIQRNFNCC